jgi:hypothetical protein
VPLLTKVIKLKLILHQVLTWERVGVRINK